GRAPPGACGEGRDAACPDRKEREGEPTKHAANHESSCRSDRQKITPDYVVNTSFPETLRSAISCSASAARSRGNVADTCGLIRPSACPRASWSIDAAKRLASRRAKPPHNTPTIPQASTT